MTERAPLSRRLLAELLGSAFLAAVVMFGREAISISTQHRSSPAHLLAEVIATLG